MLHTHLRQVCEQRGVFVVQNLKPLPADKDYQLWVIDPKYPTPVSAGVFQVDADGMPKMETAVLSLSSSHAETARFHLVTVM